MIWFLVLLAALGAACWLVNLSARKAMEAAEAEHARRCALWWGISETTTPAHPAEGKGQDNGQPDAEKRRV